VRAMELGGFVTEIIVYASYQGTAFFVSVETGRFGVGETNEYGDVVAARHYPTMKMALRAFVGSAKTGHDI
jgi:hypothetical protein